MNVDFIEGILYVLWRGFAIGVIISAPMGPVGILCVQRTLDKGRKAGLFTGIGAAISDLFYCLLTGFGLSFIEEFLEENQNIIQIIGSVVLIIFGIYLFRSNPSRTIKKPDEIRISKKENIISGFIFTVSNPLIIFLIIGLFARFNFLLPEIEFYHYIIGFGCIIFGALCWWWIVTYLVDKLRAHFNLRSMWLINKLTGGIIMVFGIVGIITASIALAKAETPRQIHINSAISDLDSLPALDLPAADFSLEFRARNINNEAGKNYSSVNAASPKTRHPGWAMVFTDSGGDSLYYSFVTVDDILDPLADTHMRVSVTYGDSLLLTAGLRTGFDLFTGWNAFRLIHNASEWILEGGNREYNPIVRVPIPGFKPANLYFSQSPGADLRVDWLKAVFSGPPAGRRDLIKNPDSLRAYMARSSDPVEGIWEIFDRSLDEDYLRPGGKYRLAAIADANGYDLVYIDGATKNPGLWQPGMLKVRLDKTSFKNIFDVVWYDVQGNPVETETAAEFTQPGMLTFQFPHYSSTLRMRKVAFH